MSILIISCSLRPTSRSRILGREAERLLRAAGEQPEWLDLAECTLPFCDGGASYGAAGVSELQQKVSAARAILMAVPVYNYDVNAAAKNLVELTGQAWKHKVVGFVCAAGGRGSFMSVMPFANSLMLDFRCVIVPRFVYALDKEVQQGEIDPRVRERLEELCHTLAGFRDGLEPVLTKLV